MQYWLMKSEPNVWSITDQKKAGLKGTTWDGVRNYQAANNLKKINKNIEAEVIQTKIYDIGMSLDYENLKDWFSAFYEVILGQTQGPRLGSFIKFYGIDKTIDLLEKKLK